MTAAPIFKPLALAAALAGIALLAPVTSHAQTNWAQQCAYNNFGEGAGTSCHQPFQEGLAAVLVGTADGDSAAWGFIDKQGVMAIVPAYSEARSFQNGLAAVSQQDLWGYIDTRGRWVIPPRFSDATGFNAQGTALAEEGGRDVLIDRQGKVVKTFPLGTRTSGFEPGQKLAAMEIPTPPRLVNTVTGKPAALPEGVMALAAPTSGQLPAQTRDSRYGGWWGLLDQNGTWAISPQVLRSLAPPLRDGDVVAVNRERAWEFVDVRGEALSAKRYERVERVAPGIWLVRVADGGTLLLDDKLQPMHTFESDYVGVREQDGWRFAAEPGMTLLIDPEGRLQLIPLRSGEVKIHHGRAWVYGAARRTAGVADAAGDAMSAEDQAHAADAAAAVQAASEAETAAAFQDPPVAADAATDIAEAATVADATPTEATQAEAAAAGAAAAAASAAGAAADDAMAADAMQADTAADAAMDAATAAADAAQTTANADESLYQVYGRDGLGILDEATLAQLRAYDVSEFHYARTTARDADAPLALLRPHDYGQPTGILTAAGKIVTNPDWANIDTYDVTLPLVARTRNYQAGAIGADGAWAIEPRYTEIRPFKGPYTWARTKDMLRGDALLIDARGQEVSVPAHVLEEASRLDGELLHYYARNENRQRRSGLWNVRKGAPVLKPVYEQIQEFEDDWAKVQDKNRWGVVNREGQWVVPARYDGAYDLEYLGNGLMLVEAPEGKRNRGGFTERAYRVINLRTGKTSEPVVGKPQKLADGRFLGELADASAVLIDAEGASIRLSAGRPNNKQQFGDWLYIDFDEREGAIDARGNMKVPAQYGEFNPFFTQPEGLARANIGMGYRLIDQTGKTLLEKWGDATPLASMQRVVVNDDESGSSILVDLQGREVTRLPGRYAIDSDKASEGVAPYSDGDNKYGFIDANGKRVVGAHFNQLGRMKDGLARARRLERTGKLYGYIDLTGRYAIAPAFTWAGDFSEGRALVRRNRLIEYIDTQGKTTALFGVLCDTVVIVDAEDRQSWPPRKLTCPEAAGISPPAVDNANAE
ncbi:WG repeat-containing protein [Achromobacter sp. JD417]|uniref:WG repeat-containing protein n=1 Tax=Achromobacter sp. JD417 TaxID=2893881 RepID=UPI0035A706B4